MAHQAPDSQAETPRLPGGEHPGGAALMTRGRWRMLAGVFVAAALVQAATFLLPPSLGLALVLLAVGSVLIVWRPELTLSAMVTGAIFIDSTIRVAKLRHVVAVVVVFFLVAMAAVTVRRALRLRGWGRVRTVMDWPLVIITGFALVSVLMGLLGGNDHEWLIINAWHVLNWPLFYLVVTMTANTPDRLGVNAAFLYCYGLLQLPGNVLFAGERGGGLALFAGPLLALLLLRRPPVSRALLVIGLGLSVLDTVQSSFRSQWLAVSVTLLFVLVLGLRRLRSARGLLWAVATVCGLTVLVLAAAYTLRDTPLGLGLQEGVSRSAGYRMSETLAGWRIFLQAPVLGWGFGYRDPNVWIPGLEAWGAGPVYHMFSLVILTSQGIVGMALSLWMLSRGLFGPRPRWLRARFLSEPWAALGVGLQGLLMGVLASSVFSAPRISHYDWAVVPALVLFCARWGNYRPTNAARADDAEPPAEGCVQK